MVDLEACVKLMRISLEGHIEGKPKGHNCTGDTKGVEIKEMSFNLIEDNISKAPWVTHYRMI